MSHQLLLENRALSAQLEALEREDFEIAEYLRHELSIKDDRISALHAELDEVTRFIHSILVIAMPINLYGVPSPAAWWGKEGHACQAWAQDPDAI